MNLLLQPHLPSGAHQCQAWTFAWALVKQGLGKLCRQECDAHSRMARCKSGCVAMDTKIKGEHTRIIAGDLHTIRLKWIVNTVV